MATGKAVERYRDKRTADWRRRTTYTIWYHMVKRCYDPMHDSYWEYGGRGICVYELWLYSPHSQQSRTRAEAFRNFIKDMGLRPSQHVSLDRNKVDGHYEPSNCSWENAHVQARNKRQSLYIDDPDNPGVKIPVADLADRLGISYQKLRYKLVSEGRWPGNINANTDISPDDETGEE